MVWLYYTILLLFLLAGVALVVFTLPGLWLMTVAAFVYALVTHFQFIGIKTLIVMLVVSIAGEVIELGLGGVAARKAGGGRRAAIGGVLGGIVGGIALTPLIPIPVLGTVIGIVAGSFAGAALFELLGGERLPHSLKVGTGAAAGRFAGIVIKLILGIVMLFITLIIALPLGGKAKAPPLSAPATMPTTQTAR